MFPVFPDVSPETVTESKQPWQGRTLSNLKKSALLFPVLRGTIVTDEGCFFDPSPPGFSPPGIVVKAGMSVDLGF